MDIHNNFDKQFSYISMMNGVGLNIEEKMRLEISLNELHRATEAEEVLFWGKIIGTKFDYFIALLINYKGNYEFPKKVFYYTTSNSWNFVPLPNIKKYHIEDNELIHSNLFSGEPGVILKEYENNQDAADMSMEKNAQQEKPVNPDPLDISDSEDNKIVVEEKKLNFTELDRLSFIIRIIDYETSIFPQGAFKLIPIHELRRNENFKGLKMEELKNITKYSHFRKPTQLDKIMNIEKEEAIFRTDILDDLNKDNFKSKYLSFYYIRYLDFSA